MAGLFSPRSLTDAPDDAQRQGFFVLQIGEEEQAAAVLEAQVVHRQPAHRRD